VTTDPVELFEKVVPRAFNAGVEDMRKAAQAGDEKAAYKLPALEAEPFTARVLLTGDDDDDLYLVVERGVMRAQRTAPAGNVRLAVALPKEALEIALEELGDNRARLVSGIQKVASRLSVRKAKPVFERFEAEKLRCHFVIKDTPDFAEVRLKIAVGAGEPPDKAGFTITVDFDTFEDIRKGKVKPQAIMSKLQITGDSARVMQIAMELMQQK
jgi:putative sterol carrier protein